MNFSKLFRFCPVCGSDQFIQNNVKSMRCLQCGFVYYINPSAATAAFIRNDKGELLVCKRGKNPAKDTLDLPGGFVDFEETAEEAMIREIHEETGGNVTSCSYLFSIPNQYEYSGLTVPTLDIFFECSLEKYTELTASDDVESLQFIPLEKIDKNDFGLKSIQKAVEIYLSRDH